MKLRTKIFLITGSVLGVLFLGISILLSNHLAADYAKLEKNDAQKNIERLRGVFDERIEELSVKLVDWSQWDDMYQFVDDQNAEFIASNFPNETFVNLHINFVIVINKEGKIVYRKFVAGDGSEEDFPLGLEKYFASGSQFVTFDKVSDSKQGVLVFPDGKPVVAAVRPITSSDGSAPENGVVVFGYYFDAKQSQLLSELTHTSVDSAPFESNSADDFSEARRSLSLENPLFVENPKKEANVVYGYGLVTDVFGVPALILRSGTDRSIYNKGQETVRLFAEIMLGVGILFIVTVFGLFEFLVIRKISKLSGGVKEVSEGTNQEALVEVGGRDEFSELGDEINKMLAALRAADARKQEYIKDIERMNNLMVSRELRMVELKKEIAKLKSHGQTGTS